MGAATLLTPAEVGSRLRLSKATVFKLLREGVLPSILLSPRARRISEADLTEFLERRRSGPAS
jgi:excisionase family DNA binding protein